LAIINCNTGFQPLVECWLGDCYRPDFFDYVDNKKVKNILRQITEETIEDLDNIREILESYNVTVKRPRIFDFDHIYNIYKVGGACVDDELNVNIDEVLRYFPRLIDKQGVQNWLNSYDIYADPGTLTRPPLFPRDDQIVVDDTMYKLRSIDRELYSKSYGAGCSSAIFYENLFEEIEGYDGEVIKEFPINIENCISNGPNIIRLGDTIILDGLPSPTYRYFKERFKDYKIITAFNDGHSDGIYNPIKPGAWISNGEALNFKKYFPNWDVFYLPDAQWPDMSPFLEIREKVNGKWWVPGEEHNDELIDFVDAWFSEWVGFCEETVWDVNVLVINPETVLCITENKDLFKWFRSHNIEPIVAPFRHRFFWDGGLHCLTLDIHREGGIESYAR